MEHLSRRAFLGRAGVTAAALGAAAAAGPSIIGGLDSAAGAQAPTGSAASAEHEVPALSAEEVAASPPVLAHVKDARSGEIAVFVGDREVVITDHHVAARLLRAGR